MKQNSLLLKLWVTVTFLAMLGANALAELLPLNGVSTGGVSDSYPNLFAPAALTFAVWGVIYVLLALYVLYLLGGLRGRAGEADESLLRATGVPFGFSSLFNAAWIFAWHYHMIVLSMALMAALFLCLALIFTTAYEHDRSRRDRLLIRVPFGVYFGWITVATIANMTVLLKSLDWGGFGLPATFWTAAVMAAGVFFGGATLLRFRAPAYGLVLLWAYTGILLRHVLPSGFDSRYPAVILAAAACLAVLAVLLFTVLFRRAQPRSE